jgi:hypothetical protein
MLLDARRIRVIPLPPDLSSTRERNSSINLMVNSFRKDGLIDKKMVREIITADAVALSPHIGIYYYNATFTRTTEPTTRPTRSQATDFINLRGVGWARWLSCSLLNLYVFKSIVGRLSSVYSKFKRRSGGRSQIQLAFLHDLLLLPSLKVNHQTNDFGVFGTVIFVIQRRRLMLFDSRRWVAWFEYRHKSKEPTCSKRLPPPNLRLDRLTFS